MREFVRAQALAVEPDEVEKVGLHDKLREPLQQIYDMKFAYIWAMSPNAKYLGKDWNGFGCIRWQFVGFRSIVFLRFKDIYAHIDKVAGQRLPEANGAFTFEEVREILSNLTKAEVETLECKRHDTSFGPKTQKTDRMEYPGVFRHAFARMLRGFACGRVSGALRMRPAILRSRHW